LFCQAFAVFDKSSPNRSIFFEESANWCAKPAFPSRVDSVASRRPRQKVNGQNENPEIGGQNFARGGPVTPSCESMPEVNNLLFHESRAAMCSGTKVPADPPWISSVEKANAR